MKAIGIVSYEVVHEIDYTRLIRIPMHLRSNMDFVPDQDTPTRRVPFIKVELRPSKNFCSGMAYEYMEDESAKIVTIEMDVTGALIIYLDTLGTTSQKTLHDMARSIGYKGLTTPDPWADIIDEVLGPVR